jgi:hypothetical protein
MNWDDGELTIEHSSGRKSLARSDVVAIHFKCSCEARLDIPHGGPRDYSPGSIMDVTGGFVIECPHCGTTFSWNCNAPEVLHERRKEPDWNAESPGGLPIC